MARRSGTRTVKVSGPKKRHWYWNAGYLVVSAFFIGYLVYNWPVNTMGFSQGATLFMLSGFVVVFGSFATYLTLFLDNVHIRERHRWTPRWYLYFAFGAGIPLALYLFADSVNIPNVGSGAFGIFVFTTIAMNLAYLVQRHRHVGIP